MADQVVADLPVPVAAEPVCMGGAVDGVVPVPGGQLRRGAQADVLPGWLPWPGGERTSASVDPLMVDEFPVTVTDYDRFVAAIADQGHAFCHPDEPSDKSHRRSTIGDRRFGDEHPATGIDWYDAFAYAAWRGKRLPTEDEWEWAARGASRPLFPWGDEFEGSRCRWLGDLLDGVVDGESWRRVLLTVDLSALPELTCPIRDARLTASPFGARGMAGNVWEWTATRFVDRAPLSPRFGTVDPGEVIGNWAAEAVIKGGSYTSCPDQLSPAYRGPMLLFNRSPEVGFRCVVTVRR
jgi:formylglycine-generating enzyme required for sulfatase activity